MVNNAGGIGVWLDNPNKVVDFFGASQ
jgi:hypothetical protein